jgi:hypothetical protein
MTSRLAEIEERELQYRNSEFVSRLHLMLASILHTEKVHGSLPIETESIRFGRPPQPKVIICYMRYHTCPRFAVSVFPRH